MERSNIVSSERQFVASDRVEAVPDFSQDTSTHREWVECGKTLIKDRKQNPDNFPGFARVTACVLNSARPLRRSELECAYIVSDRIVSGRCKCGQSRDMFASLVGGEGSIFRTDPCGHVIFRSSHMYTFLRSFEAEGIDLSHKTLATVCKFALMEKQTSAESGKTYHRISGEILPYAEEHYQMHSSLAWDQWHRPRTRRDLNDSFLPGRLADLDLEDSDDEWEVL